MCSNDNDIFRQLKMEKVNINGKDIFLKKNIFNEYRVVFPIKKENGKINWFYLLTGGWSNLIFLLILLSIISFIGYSYLHDINMCKELIECGAKCSDTILNTKLNTNNLI